MDDTHRDPHRQWQLAQDTQFQVIRDPTAEKGKQTQSPKR